MASFSCHVFGGAKQVRLERIVRPLLHGLTHAIINAIVRVFNNDVVCRD